MEETNLTKKERRALAKEERRREREKEGVSNKFKKLFIFVVIFLAIGFLGYRAYKYITSPIPKTESESVEIRDIDWVKGEKNAPVTLIEYGDFECPACAEYNLLINKLMVDFPTNLRVVYRHYPLVTVHKKAMIAAKASEAAGKQGKFWEMVDVLYEKQKDWVESENPEEKFVSYINELGLNKETFLQDLENKQLEEKINQDMQLAISLRITSTPAFFLNGQKVQLESYEGFKKLVEEQLRGYRLE